MARPTRDIAQVITNLIIEKLEAGAQPWKRPWSKAKLDGPPLRHNGIAYSGINRWVLWAIADAAGYSSRFWMTYKQAQALGGQVRRGEQGAPCVFFKTIDRTKPKPGQIDADGQVRIMRSYTVFNRDQVEGLDEDAAVCNLLPPPSESEVEAFFAAIPIDVRHGGGRAFYDIAADFVRLPNVSDFESVDHYQATRAHELTHATGAKHRLDREFGKRFGDRAYAFEELVAEMGSSMVCAHLGLPASLHDSHANYIADWLAILKADKRAIITAASKAEAAFNWLVACSEAELAEAA